MGLSFVEGDWERMEEREGNWVGEEREARRGRVYRETEENVAREDGGAETVIVERGECVYVSYLSVLSVTQLKD